MGCMRFVFDRAKGKGLMNCPTLHLDTYVTKIDQSEVFIRKSGS